MPLRAFITAAYFRELSFDFSFLHFSPPLMIDAYLRYLLIDLFELSIFRCFVIFAVYAIAAAFRFLLISPILFTPSGHYSYAAAFRR